MLPPHILRMILTTGCATVAMIAPQMAHANNGLSAEDVIALRAEIAALRAQVQALEGRIAKAEQETGAALTAGTPVNALSPAGEGVGKAPVAPVMAATNAPASSPVVWKGAPQHEEEGWSFKAKGRIQADASIVAFPDTMTTRSGEPVHNPAFASEMRRIRLGGEGSMPGNFSYKLEVELSDNQVDLVDTFIGWKSGNLNVRLGNQNQFQSLDELIGDTTGSVMERAAFTDAFGFERRLGLALEWQKGPWMVQAGAFTDDISALSNDEDGDKNSSYSLDSRIVFAPKIGKTQLHLGASGHWRDLNSLSDTGEQRYRQRPYSHVVNIRPIDTGGFLAKGESHYGLELAATHGRWHAAAETHWLTVDRIDGLNPTFFGGYAEIGYFLTSGDTRAYKKGIFDRSLPANPVDQGGIGSIHLTLRYDYLNMNDHDIKGGIQNGYIAGLVWAPIDYLRFNINYARMHYKDAAILADGKDRYGIDVIGLRAELDY